MDGRGETIVWPPRSPDLNPLDYYLWRYFKEVFYETTHNSERLLGPKLNPVVERVENYRLDIKESIKKFYSQLVVYRSWRQAF